MTGRGLKATEINGRFSQTHPHGFNWFNPYAKRLTKSVYLFSSEYARRTWSKVSRGGTALALFRSADWVCFLVRRSHGSRPLERS
jgi:hypothetical protein